METPTAGPSSASLRGTQRLRALLARPGLIRSLAAHDVFSALVMQQAGLELVFLGGFGAAASLLGLPDLGLMTLTEMADAVRRMSQRLAIPLIADGDTGHGGLPNVCRTLREFELGGAAGLLLEDQVFPKRCGHFAGKQVVPCAEMLDKLKAALDTRRDPNFVLIARTDARAVEGLSAAIDRACRYAEAGADLCFVEAPQSTEELARIAREIPRPQLANMLPGGETPLLSCAALERLGFKIAVDPIASLLYNGRAIRRLVESWQSTGALPEADAERLSFAELKQLLGAE